MSDITEHKLTSRRKPRQVTNQDQPQNTAQYVEKLETLLSLVPYYLFVVDVSTRTISFSNKALAKSLGLVDHQVAKGKAIAECFSPEYTRQIIWQQQQVLTHNKVFHLQEEVKLADGVHYFDTTVTPIKNDEGEIYALLHTLNDVQNIAATQKALSQRSLQLEAANRELESFSYSVSHDLQSPLRIINGFSQVLWSTCQPDLNDHARHYLERIQANSQKMSNLIDALLELSRVTRSEMKSIEVNLSQIAQNIIEELQTQNPDRQVEIKIAPDLKAQGDPQLLKIVLDNLLHNAWKYTSKRSLAKIEFDVLTANGEQTAFYVRDNGAGFDQDYADKLFTAFQRLHSQAEFPGTGIGLATVQRIVYRHGGKVWAKGECDRGTTIYFCL
ncbi:ATP-binding protein [Pleurocapsa sp. FMAR1]|uniref:ATP-binding protein n=1 Tax=Pleurocapsa sp. FMAR1 TaxID=3040204 RepID=UPI0029C9A508|nr:ATP-binding protein [Pleurocapsa sp. FMAR1]